MKQRMNVANLKKIKHGLVSGKKNLTFKLAFS